MTGDLKDKENTELTGTSTGLPVIGRQKVGLSRFRAKLGKNLQDQGKKKINFWSNILALAGVVSVVSLTSWIWIDSRDRFPKLAPGTYAGEIGGVPGTGLTKPVRMVIEITDDETGVAFISAAGWSPLNLHLVFKGRDSKSSKWLYPPTLFSPKREKFKLIGRSLDGGLFKGMVKLRSGGLRGYWHLQRLETDKDALPEIDYHFWYRLKAELGDIEAQIIAGNDRLAALKREAQTVAEEKFGPEVKRSELRTTFREIENSVQDGQRTAAVKAQELKMLEKQLAMAQEITKMGRLVALARQSNEREVRWAESVLKAGATGLSLSEEKLAQQAEEIVRLKQEIAVERDAIFRLREQAGYPR